MLLIDARRGVMDSDEQAMALFDGAAVAYQAVLTKSDALKPAAGEQARAAVAETLKAHPATLPDVLATSAETGGGLPALRQVLAQLSVW
jgi:GTP-binding protein